MSNTCKDCESFRTIGFCTTRDNYTYEEDNACSEFEGNELYTRKTVFDQITASPEVLAPEFVYKKGQKMIRESKDYDGWNVHKISTQDIWKSTITHESYKTKPEAIAATVAKLKEVDNGGQ